MSKVNRERAEEYLDAIEKGDAIAIIWQIEDVHTVAKEMDLELTDDQAREILAVVDKRHDATIGIDWTVIEARIDMWKYNNEQ